MKKHLLAIISVALLAAPMAAGAIPYQIALTEYGLGDEGPDWFGTFEAPDTGLALTSFSAVIDGVTYSHLWPILTPIFYGPSDPLFANLLGGIVGPFAFHDGDISTSVLQFDARNIGGDPVGRWSLSPCAVSSAGSSCGGGFFQGTYTVTRVGVTEPGTLALFGLVVGGLGFARRRALTMSRASLHWFWSKPAES